MHTFVLIGYEIKQINYYFLIVFYFSSLFSIEYI